MLLRRCLEAHDQELWGTLVRRLQPVFARVAYRVASNAGSVRGDEVDDLVQDCFLKLEALRGGTSESSALDDESTALAYIKVLAANTARDHFRKKRAEKRGNALTLSASDKLWELVDPDWVKLEKSVMIGEIDRLLDVDVQTRTIFWLYYNQGLTAKEISAVSVFNLSPKGVESLLRRLTLAVREKFNCRPEGFSRTETS